MKTRATHSRIQVRPSQIWVAWSQSLLVAILILIVVGLYLPASSPSATIAPDARDFAKNMKKAELVFAGSLTNIEFVPDMKRAGSFFTDLTFRVDQLIKGEPNIDEKTVKFSFPGGKGVHPLTGKFSDHFSMFADNLPELAVGDQVLLILQYNPYIAEWMPRYNGLYLVSPIYGCWYLKEEDTEEGKELMIVVFGGTREKVENAPLPTLPIQVYRKMTALALNHPDRMNGLIKEVEQTIMQTVSIGLNAKSKAFSKINTDTRVRIETVINELEAADRAKVENRNNQQ